VRTSASEDPLSPLSEKCKGQPTDCGRLLWTAHELITCCSDYVQLHQNSSAQCRKKNLKTKIEAVSEKTLLRSTQEWMIQSSWKASGSRKRKIKAFYGKLRPYSIISILNNTKVFLQLYSKSILELNSKKVELAWCKKFSICIYVSFLHLKPDFRYSSLSFDE